MASISMTTKRKILSLTGSFETSRPSPQCYGCVSGNFDEQGLSWGVLQWNLGQGTLQPLWKQLVGKEDVKVAFKSYYPHWIRVLNMDHKGQMEWANRISYPKDKSIVVQPWSRFLGELGMTESSQLIQVKASEPYFLLAASWAKELGLHSERALALLFDIAVQNGSLKHSVKEQVKMAGNKSELERLVVLAEAVADTCNTRWKDDVLSRKMTIAEGEGIVHGRKYVLMNDLSL